MFTFLYIYIACDCRYVKGYEYKCIGCHWVCTGIEMSLLHKYGSKCKVSHCSTSLVTDRPVVMTQICFPLRWLAVYLCQRDYSNQILSLQISRRNVRTYISSSVCVVLLLVSDCTFIHSYKISLVIWRWLSYWVLRLVVWQKLNDVSEVFAAFIVSAMTVHTRHRENLKSHPFRLHKFQTS
jgi:hypothetical protein